MGDRRPNCVVLDEIDGVMNGSEGRGTIDQLLRLLRVDGGGGEAAGGAAGGYARLRVSMRVGR